MFQHPDSKLILSIGCPGIVLMLASCIMTVFLLLSGRSVSTLTWVLGVVGVILFIRFMIGGRDMDKRVRDYQKKRDAEGKQIRDAVLAGEWAGRPFFIYLRPFAIDGKFYAAPSGIPADQDYVETYGWPTSAHDLESTLANLVYACGLLVAISNKPGDAGPAHVKASAETWREDVMAICGQAAGIFMVPFDYDGTAWEVNLLVKSGWLEKTFFVMPAEQYYNKVPVIRRLTVDYRELWAGGRGRYKDLTLPVYDPKGALLQVIDGDVTRYHLDRKSVRARLENLPENDITALQARLRELATGSSVGA